jgi:hypothetical protein
VADQREIAHMFQLFTVLAAIFPFYGSYAHFSPARASKLRINQVFAQFWRPIGLKVRICSSYLQFQVLFFHFFGASAHFPHARALKLHINRVCAHFGG